MSNEITSGHINLKKQAEEAKKIEEYLALEKKKFQIESAEPRLLLLGSSDSGKSTFLKQLKILHGKGFTPEELQTGKENALYNVLDAIEKALESSSPEWISQFQQILQFKEQNSSCTYFPDDIIQMIVKFYQNEELQKKVQDLPNIPQTTTHFLEHISKIGQASYIMTNKDMLLLRTVTTCIQDMPFTTKDGPIHIIDVSGLKHHRKQWIPYFSNVLSIIFLVSLPSYNETMAEDPSMNRLQDSLNLFDYIVNHPMLTKPSIIVFFNKKDVFEQIILKYPLKDRFPGYNGPLNSCGACYSFIKSMFVSVNKNKSKTIMTHLTCCTDTSAMKKISQDIFTTVLLKATEDIGL
ncbi:guanine nucleotide binding protein, alpha subunit [Globomyces pollinis-pini]|nr:guanine nucleotide binding protein, alpha subunit [Globomyces pollinis-pini]